MIQNRLAIELLQAETKKKNSAIYFRVTEAEKYYIELKAKERNFSNLSEFIIASIIKPEVLDKKKMKDMAYEVNKIGVNLNQCVRKMHSQLQEKEDTKKLFNELLSAINETNLRLEMVINTFRSI